VMPQQRIRLFASCALAILAAALIGILLTSGASLTPASASAQDQLWQELPSDTLDALSASRQSNQQFWSAPRQYRAFQLNEAALARLLADAPKDFTEAAKDLRNEIPVPMPDGSFARFHFVESQIMAHQARLDMDIGGSNYDIGHVLVAYPPRVDRRGGATAHRSSLTVQI
jgi:hypothetical protein